MNKKTKPAVDHASTLQEAIGMRRHRKVVDKRTDEARREIKVFHVFLQKWIAGRVKKSESLFSSGIANHFAESFKFVMPDGTCMQRSEIISALQGAYGTDPTFKIKIRIQSVRAVAGGVFLVLYEESQIEEGVENRRLSLAVLAKHSHGPQGLTWLHCHESPLSH